MWENEEGHKFDVQMPGLSPQSRPSYIHMNKKNLEALEFLSLIERKKYPFPIMSRMLSKMTVPGRMVNQIVNNDTGWGPLFTEDEDAPSLIGKVFGVASQGLWPIGLKKPFKYLGEKVGLSEPTQSGGMALAGFAGFMVRKGESRRFYPGKQGSLDPDFVTSMYAGGGGAPPVDRNPIFRNLEQSLFSGRLK
jgi:hypothetical protein